MRSDHQKPALVTVFNLLGWLAILVAAGLAVVRSGYYKPPLLTPRVSSTEVISVAFGGILLFGLARIIRVLHRIEQEILETRAALLTGLSVRVKGAQQTKESFGR